MNDDAMFQYVDRSMETAPSGLGELPDIGWELHHLRALIDDLWTRFAINPDEVRAELLTITGESARLSELVHEAGKNGLFPQPRMLEAAQ